MKARCTWRHRGRLKSGICLAGWSQRAPCRSAFCVVLFFSFSTRQEYYVLPALPALVLLIGGWLAEEETSPAASPLRRWGKLSSLFLAVLGLLVCFVAVLLVLSLAGSAVRRRQHAFALGTPRVTTIRPFTRSHSRSQYSRDGGVPHPPPVVWIVIVCGFRTELAISPPPPPRSGQLVLGLDECLPASSSSHRIGHVQSDSYFKTPSRRDRAGFTSPAISLKSTESMKAFRH